MFKACVLSLSALYLVSCSAVSETVSSSLIDQVVLETDLGADLKVSYYDSGNSSVASKAISSSNSETLHFTGDSLEEGILTFSVTEPCKSDTVVYLDYKKEVSAGVYSDWVIGASYLCQDREGILWLDSSHVSYSGQTLKFRVRLGEQGQFMGDLKVTYAE